MGDTTPKPRGNTTDQRSLTERLQANYAEMVCWSAGFAWGATIPRRLGGAATGAELSRDKKMMRKLAHLYTTMTGMWMRQFKGLSDPEPAHIAKESKIFGAQVLPEQWVPKRLIAIEVMRTAVMAATTEDPRYSRAITNRLAHEEKELLRIAGLEK